MKPWQLQPVYPWQKAPFLRILPPFLAGILLYDAGALPIRNSIAAILAVLPAIALIVLHRRSDRTMPVRLLRSVGYCSLFLLAGWLRSFYADDRNDPEWIGREPGRDKASVVRLLETPVARERTFRARVAVLQLLEGGRMKAVSGEARLYFYRDPLSALPYAAGDTLIVPAGWEPVANSTNPFAYDFARSARRTNTGLQQFVAVADVLPSGKHNRIDDSWLERTHQWSVQQLRETLGDGPAFGLLQAMLLGDERDFDPELRQTYSETGVVHIVSISGSHTALLFAIVAAAFGWIRKRRVLWIKYVPGVALVWCYVLMAGAPPSALRSAVMFTVFALGAATGRDHQPFNTLLAAGFLLLLADPAALFSVGFQLSFLAVLSLLIFYKPLYYGMQKLIPLPGRIGKTLYAGCAASIAAEILTAPLVMHHFHNFPLLFLPANLLASLLLGFVCMIGGLLILALSWWPAAAGLCGAGVSFVVSTFNSALLWMNGWSPAWTRHIWLSNPELWLLYAVIATFALAVLRKLHRAAFAGLASACLLVICLISDDLQARRQQRLVVFSSGRDVRIEVYRGKSRQVLMGDDPGKKHRASEDAAIGYHAWARSAADQRTAFQVGNTSVLLLREPLKLDTACFPADVVIVGYTVRPAALLSLWKAFPADTLVLAGWQSRRNAARLEDTARKYRIPLHIAVRKGAFVQE